MMTPKTKDALSVINAAVQTRYVTSLMSNPGHVNGYNEEVYLKNDAFNRKEYLKALRAIKTLAELLYFS